MKQTFRLMMEEIHDIMKHVMPLGLKHYLHSSLEKSLM